MVLSYDGLAGHRDNVAAQAASNETKKYSQNTNSPNVYDVFSIVKVHMLIWTKMRFTKATVTEVPAHNVTVPTWTSAESQSISRYISRNNTMHQPGLLRTIKFETPTICHASI